MCLLQTMESKSCLCVGRRWVGRSCGWGLGMIERSGVHEWEGWSVYYCKLAKDWVGLGLIGLIGLIGLNWIGLRSDQIEIGLSELNCLDWTDWTDWRAIGLD